MNPRLVAAQILAAVLKREKSLARALPESLHRVAERDRGLLQQLCYGTLRWQPRLDLIARQLLKKPFKAKDQDLQALVLLGLYQLQGMRIPAHAAISETVSATAGLRKTWAKGLINGVLRNFQRESAAFEEKLGPDPRYRHAHPQWLFEDLKRAWPEHWPTLLEQNNQQPPLCLRVNARQGSAEAYQARLTEAGIASRFGAFAAEALYLEQACDVEQLPGFDSGAVSVQDEAAQLAAALLDLQPGARLLDACCAPGGKSCHILERQPDLAQLDALDMDGARLLRVQDNLERLQLSCNLIEGDASQRNWWDGQAYDRILADVPCSATGVIRRNPDIKYLRQRKDIAPLVALQAQILDNLWGMLKAGGRLVYATCSVLPAENEEQIQAFLSRHPDAHLQPIEGEWGEPRPAGRQLFPQPGGHDGFYYAIMEKQIGADAL